MFRELTWLFFSALFPKQQWRSVVWLRSYSAFDSCLANGAYSWMNELDKKIEMKFWSVREALCCPDALFPVRAVKDDLRRLCETVEPLFKTLAVVIMAQPAKGRQTHIYKLQLRDSKQTKFSEHEQKTMLDCSLQPTAALKKYGPRETQNEMKMISQITAKTCSIATYASPRSTPPGLCTL